MRTQLLTLIGLLLLAAASFAQGVILPERVILPEPRPIPVGTAPLRLDQQSIRASLRDGAATTTVEQAFHNQYNHRLEGTFLFPLPEDASVSDFAMSINGQMISAELLDAKKARQVYEDIVRRQKDPGLLEYLGRTCFRARIFPIEPGETKKIKLEYTQAVNVDDGLARWVFPLRTRAFDQVPLRPWPGPHPLTRDVDVLERRGPDVPPGRIGSLGVEVAIESATGLKTVYSPSHDIDVRRDGDHKVTISYEASNLVPTQDFLLFYQLSDTMFGLNLLTWRGADEDGYFMLLLAPKSEVRERDVQAKDILFVFDVSGSMSGAKIQQAKDALVFCLEHLNPGDRFNVLSFSTGVDSFEAAPVAATPEARSQATEFVRKLQARGGTNIDEALKTALGQLQKDPARPSMVLFLTDGQPTVGVTEPVRILDHTAQANRADARLFVFGVGHDLNAMLLDRLSDDNHGTRTFVKPDENIEVAISSLYSKIASPVLSDLRLDVQGVKVTDLYPSALPDLFRGSQVTLLGRYSGDGPAKVTLKGLAAGQDQVFDYSADFPRRNREHSFIPRLWATRRIGYLLDQLRLHGQAQELVEEVVRLATRHGILTPYTSYLVLEPGMTAGTEVAEALRRPRGAANGQPGAAPEPALSAGRPTDATVGGGAVMRSEGERALKDADRAAPSEAGAALRTAGARTFYLVDQTWVDSTYPKEPGQRRVIRIKYGSNAWLDLLNVRDDLAEILAVGTRLKVPFGETLLVIDEDGAEQLSDADRQALRN